MLQVKQTYPVCIFILVFVFFKQQDEHDYPFLHTSSALSAQTLRAPSSLLADQTNPLKKKVLGNLKVTLLRSMDLS